MRKSIIFLLVLSFIAVSASAVEYECGDVNNDNNLNILDVVSIINYLYKGGQAPAFLNLADVNYSGTINILDATCIISFLYKGGQSPNCPPGISGDPEIVYGENSGCKSFEGLKSEEAVPPDQDCISYSYDGIGGTLDFTHINAGFNCCPGVISAAIDIVDDTIIVTESENYDEFGPCYCLCLYDVEYYIINLQPGEYTVKIIGLELNEGDEYLQFTIDLTAQPTGEYCLTRDHYPWGYGMSPSGFLTETYGCKTDGEKADSTLEQDCIVYDYDGNGNLYLTHVNDLFNCCPESLYATVDFEDNYIIIQEYETDGLCDCVCLFDLDYQITNLSPGEYTIIVDNVYYYGGYNSLDPIQFTIDLYEPTSGVYCVDRPYLPWWP